MAQTNHTFTAIESRQAVRSFAKSSFPLERLLMLLGVTQRAPSGYNLQPWHFVIVRDQTLKQLLFHVALKQRQVLEAPFTVIFVANPRFWKETYPRVLELGRKDGSMTERRIAVYNRIVKVMFYNGPFGIFGLLKRISIPLLRLRKPTPDVITSEKQAVHYVREQTMLTAATFMIAAKSDGLDTCPMEGFDEYRLKKLLKIPPYMSVPVIISIGEENKSKPSSPSVRLPLEDVVSIDRYPNILSRISSEQDKP